MAMSHYRALIVLAGIILISAIAVIYTKYHSRLLFIDIQKQERALDKYEVEWGQMQLELSMLAEQNRVETIASHQLKLIVPVREKIVYLKP
jgi:cell division protein FtsL